MADAGESMSPAGVRLSTGRRVYVRQRLVKTQTVDKKVPDASVVKYGGGGVEVHSKTSHGGQVMRRDIMIAPGSIDTMVMSQKKDSEMSRKVYRVKGTKYDSSKGMDSNSIFQKTIKYSIDKTPFLMKENMLPFNLIKKKSKINDFEKHPQDLKLNDEYYKTFKITSTNKKSTKIELAISSVNPSHKQSKPTSGTLSTNFDSDRAIEHRQMKAVDTRKPSTLQSFGMQFISQLSPRSNTESHGLLQLINGVMIVSMSGSYSIDTPVRVMIGEGNNSKLVYTLLREKGNVVSESFFSKSNLQWTQSYSKHLVAVSLGASCKQAYTQIPSLSEINTNDPDMLALSVMNKKIFRVSSIRLIKELVNCTIRTGSVIRHYSESLTYCNHVKGLSCISQKSQLVQTLVKFAKKRRFNVFCMIPRTFIIKSTSYEEDMFKLLMFKSSADPLFSIPLIIKPGENSNRGAAISMAYNETELRKKTDELLRTRKAGSSALVQFYISNPLLYKRRKFDIRCYGLVVKFSNRVSFYWYLDGYGRTSSFVYDIKDKSNAMVHLTNEAIQIKSIDYLN